MGLSRADELAVRLNRIATIALLAATRGAFAQAPVIGPGGVQNASNRALTSIAPQVLVAIKGQDLATSTETAIDYQLLVNVSLDTISRGRAATTGAWSWFS